MRSLRIQTALVTVCAIGTLLARGWSHAAWPIDLVATFSLHWAYLFVAVGLVLLLRRTRLAALILFCAAGVHFAWSLAEGPPRATDDAETIRIMSFNIHFGSRSAPKLLDLIASGPADVIVLIESKKSFNDRLRSSKEIAAEYPYQLLFHNFAKLSRWPLDLVPSDTKRFTDLEHNYNYRFTPIVRHPRTPFVLLTLAPRSPRSAAHWADGNRYLQREIALFKRFFVPLQLPLVVAGDLNASPTSWRSKLLRDQLGLIRSKPPLQLAGSWPANIPAPLRVPIDAVLLGPGISVANWHLLNIQTGSDHVPVVAEISIPHLENPSLTKTRPTKRP